MAAVILTDAQKREAVDLWLDHGRSVRAAAAASGLNYYAYRYRLDTAKRDGFAQSAGVASVISKANLLPAEARGGWLHTYDSDGKKIGATRWANQDDAPDQLLDALREGLESITPGQYSAVPSLPAYIEGALLVIDLADVHIGKLCVKSETGFEYSRDVAVTRMLQGTRALLDKASLHGIARVLLVIGNDILHVDSPKHKTTSGTEQDTSGSIHEMYQDAQAAYVAVIEACAEKYAVDLIYCPSNHDWLLGWALSNSIGVWFRDHPNVTASEYNLSERHRKYYRYEDNLIGLTHGDGAKESDLYALMMTEARSHVSDCPHRYWYLHHVHHKVRKAQGVRPHDREKDHIGLTMIKSGVGAQEGDNINIEYVRSPSPPDGWHDRNGYVNRQAVECFIHEPANGQTGRFTHWF